MNLRLLLFAIPLSFLIVLVGTEKTVAQDIHYSQFYAAPLTLNPSLTGKFNGNIRAAGIYRNQWSSFGDNILDGLFVTPSISVDFSLFKGALGKDALGVGVLLLNDRAGNFTNTTIGGSLAYHIGLGAQGATQISLGVQGAYVQKQFDLNSANFADDFDAVTLAELPDGSSLEGATFSDNSYIDFNGGILLNSRINSKTTLFGGFSWFHFTTPEEKFSGSTSGTSELPARQLVHIGAEYDLTDRIVLIPGALWQTQAKASEINFGLTGGYHLGALPSETTVFLGLWHRWEESMIAKAGFEYQQFRFGLAYDFTVSGLRDTKEGNARSSLPTSFELALTYIHNVSVPKEDIYLFNPRY